MESEAFSYTYSADQQQEVLQIRQKYLPPVESRLEQLRRLDRSTTRRGTRWSILLGSAGTLLLGLGMSCALAWDQMVPGIVLGVPGIVGIALACPLYHLLCRRDRARLAPEILRLSEELLSQGGQ